MVAACSNMAGFHRRRVVRLPTILLSQFATLEESEPSLFGLDFSFLSGIVNLFNKFALPLLVVFWIGIFDFGELVALDLPPDFSEQFWHSGTICHMAID